MSSSLCILSMQFIILLSFVVSSNSSDFSHQIPLYLVTPQTMPKIMNCKVNPMRCQVKQVWLIMFFNSSDSRQRDTFQYLIPKFAKQIAYTKQTEQESNSSYSGRFHYPKTAVIDCFSSGKLCSTISEQELPLVIINNHQAGQLIYYKGYVTLSGLISFVKTHEPKTSYLAGWYQRSSSKTISTQNFSEKKIQKTFKKIRQNIEHQLSKKLQDLSHIYAERDFSSNYGEESKQKQPEYKQQNWKQNQSSIQAQKSQQSNLLNNANKKVQDTSLSSGQSTNRLQKQEYTSEGGQKVEVESNKQEKREKKKSKKSKKQKNQTGPYQSYIDAVESTSQFFLDIFRSLHLPSQIIQIIGYVVYPIFYILFGVICIAVAIA